jgi:lactoylglutathione lyase
MERIAQAAGIGEDVGQDMRNDRLVHLRMELIVDDLDATIAFYTALLGFRIDRRTDGYASLSRGQVVLGFGLMANLSVNDDSGPGPAWRTFERAKGVGVEIVLELDDVGEVFDLYEHCRSRIPDIEPLRLRPWGLHDFRLFDPDGYYMRLTHLGADR